MKVLFVDALGERMFGVIGLGFLLGMQHAEVPGLYAPNFAGDGRISPGFTP